MVIHETAGLTHPVSHPRLETRPWSCRRLAQRDESGAAVGFDDGAGDVGVDSGQDDGLGNVVGGGHRVDADGRQLDGQGFGEGFDGAVDRGDSGGAGDARAGGGGSDQGDRPGRSEVRQGGLDGGDVAPELLLERGA